MVEHLGINSFAPKVKAQLQLDQMLDMMERSRQETLTGAGKGACKRQVGGAACPQVRSGE